MVCHEDVPDTQHPHHHDLVLEAHHAHDETPGAAGEVRPRTAHSSNVMSYIKGLAFA